MRVLLAVSANFPDNPRMCKSMNSSEVSRMAGFCTDLRKKK